MGCESNNVVFILLPTLTVTPHATHEEDDSLYDDLRTSSDTGDSGFSDSKEFLKISLSGQHHRVPGQATVQTNAQCTPGQQGDSSDGCEYAPLTMNGLHANYYKSLQREGIQGRQKLIVLSTCIQLKSIGVS